MSAGLDELHNVHVLRINYARNDTSLFLRITSTERTRECRFHEYVPMMRKKIIAAALVLLLYKATQCANNCKPTDCYDLRCFRRSKVMDGPFIVYPGVAKMADTVNLVCDQLTDGGAWQVILRRDSLYNYTDFNTTLQHFKVGVGDQFGGRSEFYLGHELIHQITSLQYPDKCAEIRLEAMIYDGATMGVSALNFTLGEEKKGYRWHCGGEFSRWNSDENMLNVYNNRPFSRGNRRCRAWFGNLPFWYVPNTTCTKIAPFGTNTAIVAADSYRKQLWLNLEGMSPTLTRWMRLAMRPYRINEDPSRVCNNPCLNGGTCMYEPITNTHRCICHKRYCGIHCEKAKSDCKNGGLCVYLGTDPPFCKCRPTHCGHTCMTPNPCNNSGTCELRNGQVLCKCPPGIFGTLCEVNAMCQNGGTVIYNSDDGSIQCSCPSMFCGDKCENIDCDFTADPCTATPCKNGGTCLYNKDAQKFSCDCTESYKGLTCRIKRRKVPIVLSQQDESYGYYLYIPILLLLAMLVIGFTLFMVKKYRDDEAEKDDQLPLIDQAKTDEEEPGIFGFLGF